MAGAASASSSPPLLIGGNFSPGHSMRFTSVEERSDIEGPCVTTRHHSLRAIASARHIRAACRLTRLRGSLDCEASSYHTHPDSVTEWKDDVRLWPGIRQADIEITYVKGKVKPSQSVNSRANSVWVCAKNSGEVLTAQCSCMAGQARPLFEPGAHEATGSSGACPGSRASATLL
ncbi:hypothetical protein HPB47_002150 [Ixodes persulcatus]|uniref:Uncharacterized protein n=1 Tax=Ixodes persulcatus TaxID=34615 RepID=A0AC60PMX8_IXOPE|nr:hypothetical protein HPB47_002150 [Ixodes persulcatus]